MATSKVKSKNPVYYAVNAIADHMGPLTPGELTFIAAGIGALLKDLLESREAGNVKGN